MRTWLAVTALVVSMALPSGVAAGRASAQVGRLLAAGETAYKHQDYRRAISLWQRALHDMEKARDPRLGDVFFYTGNAYYGLDDYGEALASFQRALAIYRKGKSRPREAADLSNIGLVQEKLSRYADSLASLQQALALYRDLRDRSGEADGLGNVGVTQMRLGRYADALASHTRALLLHRAIRDRGGEANDLTNLGLVEDDLGRYEEALASQEQALAIHREVKDHFGEASDLGNAGNLEDELGRYAEALAAHQQALALDREAGSRFGEANELGNIGIVEAEQGRYDEALAAHREALDIDRAIRNPIGQSAELGNIGNVENALGRYAEALATHQQALALDRAIHYRRGEAGDLTNIGIALQKLLRFAEALSAQQQALAIAREVGNRVGESSALTNIGTTEGVLGRYPEALSAFTQARALAHGADDRLGEAADIADAGVVDLLLGRYDDARAAGREAVALETQLAAPEGRWRALRVVAQADEHLPQRDEGLAAYAAALEQIEALRAGLRGAERSEFFGGKLHVYDEYIAYLQQLDAQFPGKGYARKALEIFERKSARAALEQIGRSAAHHFKGVDPQAVTEEDAAEAGVEAAENRLSKLLSSSIADRDAIGAAGRAVADAKARAALVAAGIKARFPAYYALRHPQPLMAECPQQPCAGITDLQRSVLRPGEVVLAYDLLPVKSILWLIDRDAIEAVAIAGSDEIDKAVARLDGHVAGMIGLLGSGVRAEEKLERNAAADLPGYAADSYALARMLLPDDATAALARAKSLIVIPSGSLYRLAFETLVTNDPAAGGQPHFLIADLPLSYVPSASLLKVVRDSYARPDAGRSTLLAFANPSFGAAPKAEAAMDSEPTYAALQLSAARSALRGGANAATLAEAVFPPLPGTQTEADAVRAALNAPAASLVDGDDATRQRLLDLNARDQLKTYQYLLFATHAVLPSEIQGLTQPAIVLAHPERGDGLLTMADVFGLSLDADFVALSACNTGVGTGATDGEGVSGLTRAFLYAGSPAISVTLWEVDDAAAPRITPAFFAGMHGGKLTAAEALREAKLAMLAAPEARFRHPYAWAPSVIFGDGDRQGAQ